MQVHDLWKNKVAGAFKVLRAFVALCCPIPGLCGATLEDVRYLVPLQTYKAQIAADLGAQGRIFLEKSRDGIWTERVQVFESYLGVAMMHGPDVNSKMKTCARLLADPHFAANDYWSDEWETLLNEFRARRSVFEPVIQPGGSEELDDLIVDLCKKSWKAWEERNTTDNVSMDAVSQLTTIKDAICPLTSSTGADLQRAICARLSTLKHQTTEVLFTGACQKFEGHPSMKEIEVFCRDVENAPGIGGTAQACNGRVDGCYDPLVAPGTCDLHAAHRCQALVLCSWSRRDHVWV